jgi:hypothetical protein
MATAMQCAKVFWGVEQVFDDLVSIQRRSGEDSLKRPLIWTSCCQRSIRQVSAAS